MSVLDSLPAGVVGIDTRMGGVPEITAGYLILTGERPALVETGPQRVAATVAEGVRRAGVPPEDLAYVVVTHIHLDHAGGVGDLVRAFPNATVVVHPAGAHHLSSPERLLASSSRVYGPLMDTVYGGLTPVERERIHAAEDGEALDLGRGRRLELLHAPGHAKHHMAAFEPDTGALFAGDAVGVLLPATGVLRPATPPSDFDRDLALRSLQAFRERDPAYLVLTHFGPIGPPGERLAEAEEKLRRWCETAERAALERPELDHIEAALRARFEQEEGPQAAQPERYELLNSYRSNAAGLLRWIQRRQQAAAGEAPPATGA